NYNFYLLSNGGMPGPQGTIGVDGGFGPIGAQGDTGYQGAQGYQGPQGASSLNDWVLFPESGGLPGYLYPRKNPPNDPQTAPVALRIGYLGDPQEPEYLVGVSPNNTPIQIVKAPNSSWVNFRVEDNNGFAGYHFSYKGSNLNPQFEISPNATSPRYQIFWTAKTIIFKTGINVNSLNDSIKITDSQITINGPVFNLSNVSGKFTKSQDQFRYTPDADANKVLVSVNSSGDVEWKNIKDVFGTFPIGSIISIRQSEFNTNHFWLNDSINVTSGFPLNNIYGRGKAGTDYEGWYLCNGETWETEQGFNQYLTPNLNNFSYTIDANGDVQNLVTVPEVEPVLIGGYDMRITAITDINGLYDVQYSTLFPNNDTSPGLSTIAMGTPGGGTHYTSRMIHLVYLENPNLKWSNTGNVAPPIVTTNILLTDPLTTPLAIANQCTALVTTQYNWTGPNPTTWNTFAPLSQYSLFNAGTTNFAPAGWYVNLDGYPIYWNGTSFTQRGTTCVSTPPPDYTPNLRYSLLVDDLNGPLSGFGGTDIYLDLDSGNFATATGIAWSDDQLVYQPGDPAPTGWYRDMATGTRRYWDNGTATFQGVSFYQDYVQRITVNYDGETNPGYNNAVLNQGYVDENGDPVTSICDTSKARHLTYVAGNRVLVVGNNISHTQNVKDYQNYTGFYPTSGPATNGTCLYVPLSNGTTWQPPMIDFITGDIINTPPLKEVHLQNRPGATSKYSRVYMDNSDYGVISSTTGKIGTIDIC
ncbi:MAG: collagen-like triple helix repeat-containing protein, partial [Dolichospermum sp.]